MLSLKKFIKYFDDMHELMIYDFNVTQDEEHGKLLFEGHTFDKGAKKKLKELYKQHYILDRNEDGMAVMLFPYVNKYGAKLCKVQINVKKK